MSIGGPSPLGTVLIQRLDAVLGNAVGQSTNIATGARANAVSQSPQSERSPHTSDSQNRSTRENVDRATTQQRSADNDVRHQARLDSRQATLEALLRQTSDTSSTRSAPTTLGRAARTILDIIERFPDAPHQQRSAQPLSTRTLLNGLLQGALSQTTQQHANADNARPATAAQASPSGTTSSAANPSHTSDTSRATGTAPARGETTLPSDAASAAPRTATLASVLSRVDLSLLSQHFQQALQQHVQQSGMFYESQLARFSFGQGSLNHLQQQPQNLAPNENNQTQQQGSSSHATTRGSEHNATQLLQHSGVQLDNNHQSLVRQQLDVLANQQFQWRGDAWDGVPMEWIVEREQEHQGTANKKRTVPSGRWNTQLILHLPLLGVVHIDVHLRDKEVGLSITAPDSMETLSPYTQQLAQRLQQHGLQLNDFLLQKGFATVPNNDPYGFEDDEWL